MSAVDCAPFSLFDGDLLNRQFARIGLGGRRVLDIAGRCALVVGLTWVPMALLALVQGLYSTRMEGTNYFADYAAYVQLLIALPLFIVAERVVSMGTREAARAFLETGVVSRDDVERVDASHREVERLRLWWKPEAVCIAAAYVLAFLTFLPEFRGADIVTWHTRTVGKLHVPTLPGAWALLVALPLLNYWWLRLSWKTLIWTWYLYRMSRLKLGLVASHPDRTGGIGFISEVQAKFALVIFAYGISNVAAVIAYKITIEHASPSLPPVWGTAVGFIIGAPFLFLAPLFMFTKQLDRTKRRALARYRERARHHAMTFEEKWLAGEALPATAQASELTEMNNLASVFDRIEHMRVVPFDLWSATQLIGSTAGSVATVLPLLRFEASLKDWLELLATLLRHGG